MKLISKLTILKADEVLDGDLILFPITKIEVKNSDTKRAFRQIEEFKKAGKKLKNSVMITFNYDDDSREVWEIPEVVQYMRLLYEHYPEIFYFLEIGSYNFATFINTLPTQKTATLIDQKMIDYARKIKDQEKIVTISEYVRENQ